MTKPVDVYVTASVAGVLRQITPVQRAQCDRLIAAIRIAPQAGQFYAHDGENRLLRIASAADVHLIYTVTYQVWQDRIFLVDLVVADWHSPHSDMP